MTLHAPTPTGFRHIDQGCPRSGLPWLELPTTGLPKRGCGLQRSAMTEPFQGSCGRGAVVPRVARWRVQPWAVRHNPVGVGRHRIASRCLCEVRTHGRVDAVPGHLTQTPPSLSRWISGFCTTPNAASIGKLVVQRPCSTETSSVGVLALLCFLMLLATGSAFAQEPANQKVAVPAPPVNPNPDVAAQPTIVIPYDDPKNPQAAERVFLPHAKFIELWNAAHPEQRVTTNAPQEGLVAESLFVVTPLPKKADAEGPAIARVTARVTLFSFRKQQITLPIPLRLTSVSEATLDDKPAPIVVREENGVARLHAVLDKPGLHVLDLTAEVPVQQAGPAGQLMLSLDPLSSARMLFVPDGEVTFRVNGASNTFRARKGAVREVLEVATCSGVPWDMIVPPASPLSGPISIR